MNASANRGHAESGMDGDATAFTSGTMRFADHATLVTTEGNNTRCTKGLGMLTLTSHKGLFFQKISDTHSDNDAHK